MDHEAIYHLQGLSPAQPSVAAATAEATLAVDPLMTNLSKHLYGNYDPK